MKRPPAATLALPLTLATTAPTVWGFLAPPRAASFASSLRAPAPPVRRGPTTCSATPPETTDDLRDPAAMRAREIQAELKSMGVPHSDCFDKESLARRLADAREGRVSAASPAGGGVESPGGDGASAASPASGPSPAASPPETEDTTPAPPPFDRDAVLSELRSLRASELRSRLAERNVRWGGMLEKEDLVRALADAMEGAAKFSLSGVLRPGEVVDVTDDVLGQELAGGAATPLLLDVYATWCGPCQMMALQLKAAAAELGDAVRVAKIDSDKYTNWASRLRVEGLPTVILFDGKSGKELQRVEGALMKDGLLELARSHLSK